MDFNSVFGRRSLGVFLPDAEELKRIKDLRYQAAQELKEARVSICSVMDTLRSEMADNGKMADGSYISDRIYELCTIQLPLLIKRLEETE